MTEAATRGQDDATLDRDAAQGHCAARRAVLAQLAAINVKPTDDSAKFSREPAEH